MSLDMILNKDEGRGSSGSPTMSTPKTPPPPSPREQHPVMFLGNILNNDAVEPAKEAQSMRDVALAIQMKIEQQPYQAKIEPQACHVNFEPQAYQNSHPQAAPTQIRANIRPHPSAVEPPARLEHLHYGLEETSHSRRTKRKMQEQQQRYEIHNLMSTGRQARKRGAFCEAKRNETANTRRTKACFRCRNQQIRCIPDSANPKGWCIPCQNLRDATNKKIIHKHRCKRVKMTMVNLFRSKDRGGTMTPFKRLEKPPMPVRTSGGEKTIMFTFGICEEPIKLRFSEPKSREAGSVDKSSGEEGAAKGRKELPSFDLVDSVKTTEWFAAYVERHALKQETLDLALQDSDPFIQETYKKALLHYRRLLECRPKNKTDHCTLMKDMFRLWFTLRHTVGTPWISEKDSPAGGTRIPASERTSIPAPIVSQFENILLSHVITELQGKILGRLETMLTRNKPEDWYTVYLAVFMMLHWVSVATKYQSDDAISKLSNAPYSSPEFVRELHKGANITITHWHYWRRNVKPMTIENHHSSSLSDLTDDEFRFVVESYQKMHGSWSDIEALRAQDKWEHEFFWISHMFDVDQEVQDVGFMVDQDEM